jgi:hypothetical protein
MIKLNYNLRGKSCVENSINWNLIIRKKETKKAHSHLIFIIENSIFGGGVVTSEVGEI